MNFLVDMSALSARWRFLGSESGWYGLFVHILHAIERSEETCSPVLGRIPARQAGGGILRGAGR